MYILNVIFFFNLVRCISWKCWVCGINVYRSFGRTPRRTLGRQWAVRRRSPGPLGLRPTPGRQCNRWAFNLFYIQGSLHCIVNSRQVPAPYSLVLRMNGRLFCWDASIIVDVIRSDSEMNDLVIYVLYV